MLVGQNRLQSSTVCACSCVSKCMCARVGVLCDENSVAISQFTHFLQLKAIVATAVAFSVKWS